MTMTSPSMTVDDANRVLKIARVVDSAIRDIENVLDEFGPNATEPCELKLLSPCMALRHETARAKATAYAALSCANAELAEKTLASSRRQADLVRS